MLRSMGEPKQKTNLLSFSLLILQLQKNSQMSSQNNFFFLSKKNNSFISIKKTKKIKIDYLNIYSFISTTFLKK